MTATLTTLTCPSTSSFNSIFPTLPACDISSSFETRAVRFQSECVLIPECAKGNKRPLIATKTYSIPLWSRPRKSSKSEEGEDEKEGGVWKVPIPTFKKPANLSTSPRAEPLSPCLVHRSQSETAARTSPPSPVTLHRSPTIAQKFAETVPLRSCCPDCVKTTEQSVKSGDDWEVKFSRGAARRIKSFGEPGHSHKSISEMYAIPQLVLNVDEVDKRRKCEESQHDAYATPRPSCLNIRTTQGSITPPEDDDESMLFPLPSPLRSPSASPRGSPKNSPFGTPRASPAGSTSSLSAQPDSPITPKPRVTSSPSPLMENTSAGSPQNVDSDVLVDVAPISRTRPISTISPILDSKQPETLNPPSSPSPSPVTRRGHPAPLSVQIPSSKPREDKLGALPRSLPAPSPITNSPKASRTRSKSPEGSQPYRRRPSLSSVTSNVLKVGADVLRGVSIGASNGFKP